MLCRLFPLRAQRSTLPLPVSPALSFTFALLPTFVSDPLVLSVTMLSPWCWSMRSSWLPLASADSDAQHSFRDKNARRDFFRKNNNEQTEQQKYASKLEAAGIRPEYLSNEPVAAAAAGGPTATTPAAVATPAGKPSASQRSAAVALPLSSLPIPVDLRCALRSSLARSFLSASSRSPVDWSRLPAMLVPGTHMRSDRAQRKQHQLQNMIQAVRAVIQRLGPIDAASSESASAVSAGVPPSPPPALPPRRLVIVDFCCGSGHLGFPLAWLFPQCDVILVERNATAIQRAKERLAELQRGDRSAGDDQSGSESDVSQTDTRVGGDRDPCLPLTNLRIVHCGLQDFSERFDFGIGVHACGWLSDVIQMKCAAQRAAFLLAPCCIGKIKLGEGCRIDGEGQGEDSAGADRCCPSTCRGSSSPLSSLAPPLTLHYPRSSVFSSVLSCAEYHLLASKADYSPSDWDFASAASAAGSRLKSFIEWDRMCAADESGYVSIFTKMHPISCTPKNDVIFGLPKERFIRDAPNSSTAATSL